MNAIAAGLMFACTPTAVWDGDGPIWCAEGPRVRLAAIAARELDGSCRRGHPCPRASGIAARDNLAELLGRRTGASADGHVQIRGPALRCRSAGPDDFGRTIAWCAGAAGDLSCAQVRAGMALRWRAYGGARVCRRV